MAIIKENFEEEKLAFGDTTDSYSLIMPFTLTYDEGTKASDKIEIETYPIFKKDAKEFLERFFAGDGSAIFSKEARQWIKDRVGGYIIKQGFTILEESDDFTVCCRILKSQVPTRAVRICSTKGFENLTEYDIDEMLRYGFWCYGVVEEGKILSVACSNATVDLKGKVMEIGVETAESARGQGYGRESVIALTNELCSVGYEVHYEYLSENYPSKALVSELETEPVSKTYYLVGMKN